MDHVDTKSRENEPATAQPTYSMTTDPHGTASEVRDSISAFERILASNHPVLESLLLQLPTVSILGLYQTSRFLRSFLQSCPLAWNHLSFRLFASEKSVSRQASPASDASGEVTSVRRSRPYALDQLLLTVIVPFGSSLRSIDLDNTAVSGLTLTSTILPARRGTLQHLSVRGCKHVSLKYHIVPYLTLFGLQKDVGGHSSSNSIDHLALKSLYTFRCRHHRRRPYLPATLLRRDSDAEPTHEFIKLCRSLGIWTDTAWCPTPGGRCQRRKDYYAGRGNLDGRGEVWVVFDRLWRTGNRLGRSDSLEAGSLGLEGQLWDNAGQSHEGEPLSCSQSPSRVEGKTIPAHLRRSQRLFIEDYKCHECQTPIPERCDQCSVRMHCMGCRKTLCASCAFSRPLPLAKAKNRESMTMNNTTERVSQDSFWWSPGETRNPNLMMQESSIDNGTATNQPDSSVVPAIKMHWCCLKPLFSGGTGIGPAMSRVSVGPIRAAPLPRGQGWEDSEFARIRQDDDFLSCNVRPDRPRISRTEGYAWLLHWLLDDPGSRDSSACPRSLCQVCWETPGWKSTCQFCDEPFCFAHDLRGLKMRICGYKDLSAEKNVIKSHPLGSAKVDRLLECIKALLISASALKPLDILDVASLTRLPDSNDDDLMETSASLSSDEAQSLQGGISLSDLCATVFQSRKPNAPRWRGCSSFMCPEFRPVGDHRPKCAAPAKECSSCGVHVCPACLLLDPPCDCSACKGRYCCPNCFHTEATSFCTKEEELETARQSEIAARAKREEELRQKNLADEQAEIARVFFTLVEAPESTD